jgi:serine/threonine protein kinase
VVLLPPNSPVSIKANILVDPNGHARLADFGFLTIISDSTNPTVSSSFAIGGTVRWMSPELFYPDKSGLKGARPTKQSDCYAFGMVVYEVLGGQAPFVQFHHCVVMWKVMGGERPSRPNGPEGAQFTDDLWQMLNRCWEAQPERRPSVATALECLERVSKTVKKPSQQSDESTRADEGDWDNWSDPSGAVISRFSLRYFVGFLCGVLCLSQLQTTFGKILPSEPRGGTDLGAF